MNTKILTDLVITKVYSAFTLYNPEGKGQKKNDRANWAIVIKYQGETCYTAEGKSFYSDAHHLVILPKGC